MKHVIRIVAFAAIVILLALVMVALAPAQGPTKYTPTEVQSLRLKVAQQDAMLAQRDLQDAQVKFQAKMSALRDEGERVKVESKWPKEVIFDVGTLSFVAPQPPPAPAAPAKEGAKP